MKKLAIFLIKFYQKYISPANKLLFQPGSCRFMPTCSVFAREAIEKYGIFKGVFLALWRLARCHPLSKGGFEPVP